MSTRRLRPLLHAHCSFYCAGDRCWGQRSAGPACHRAPPVRRIEMALPMAGLGNHHQIGSHQIFHAGTPEHDRHCGKSHRASSR